ncbi:MAG TPA: beta-ketoacyl-[acyl-carrier-protein] synthase family protein, partial [Actinospica sp.]|nr:beta-ketoacyl-[acyl-carrier-protein] synthase family protein [Actinospica sp.]
AGQLAVAVAEALGLPSGGDAPRTAFINACVASTNAVISAARMIRGGRAEAVICGGAYVVGEMTFSMFDSGRALSQESQIRPFSKDRSGLLLGDGAAVFVLESARHAQARGARPLARLGGWGMAADAHHVVQPHPEGAGLALAASRALARAGVEAGRIDYVNAHGTGTALNDKAETRALRRLFGAAANRIPVSSTKSVTGHMLEATGAVELAITLLALQHGRIPPTCGYRERDPECDLDYVPGESRTAEVRRALTLNAAFGGVNAALVVERV